MSSLCKYSFITINKNDSSPTPTLRKTLNPCNDLLPVKFLQTANFIKRISLLILPRTPVKASMTVETALVLPLFCFFMIHMGSAIEMMRLHGNLEVALWDAGRQVGIYGGILNAGDAGEKEDNDDRLGTVAVSYTYVKNQICNQLGEEYLEQSPLEQGLLMEALDQPDNFPQVFKKYQGLLSFPEKGLYACICSFVEETYLKSFLKDIVRILLSCGAESVFSVIYVKNSALLVLSSPTLVHQETIRQSLEELHYPQQCVTFEVSFLHGDTSEDLFAQIISKIARYDRILLIRPETGETREFHNNMAAPWRISRLREAFTASPAETDIPSLLDSVFTPSMTPDVAKNIALGLFLNPDNSGQEPPLDIACDFFRRLYSCTQTSEIRKLAEIVLLQEKDEAASSKSGANISLLKSYVEAHLDCETLSLKWLAENYLFVSVGYLSKQFGKEEGIRFSDYLNKKRMEQAIRLMVYYHNDNIKTIARSVGFGNNPQYFSQVFKKYTGYTPTEYIEREGASASS